MDDPTATPTPEPTVIVTAAPDPATIDTLTSIDHRLAALLLLVAAIGAVVVFLSTWYVVARFQR